MEGNCNLPDILVCCRKTKTPNTSAVPQKPSDLLAQTFATFAALSTITGASTAIGASGARNSLIPAGGLKLKASKSRELRASIMYTGCDCEKRNGLQDDCQRSECRGSPACLTKPNPTCGPSAFSNGKHLERKRLHMEQIRAAARRAQGTMTLNGESKAANNDFPNPYASLYNNNDNNNNTTPIENRRTSTNNNNTTAADDCCCCCCCTDSDYVCYEGVAMPPQPQGQVQEVTKCPGVGLCGPGICPMGECPGGVCSTGAGRDGTAAAVGNDANNCCRCDGRGRKV